jgi:uncharacterized protein (TIGR01244 family)
MGIQEIFNYVKVNEQLSTAGQPTEAQLQELASEGFTAVINLALVNPPHTPADEAGLLRAQGIEYVHIPVDWNNPTDADFAAFEEAMTRLSSEKVLVHCAANYRVTAFYALYAQKRLGWSAAEAEALRNLIWAGSDYPIWEAFVARKRAEQEGREKQA